MKVAMVSPDRESEKAISGYSENLVLALNKNNVETDFLTYKAGSPKSFLKLLSKLKQYNIVHVQHEYNLLGYYGLPFFLIYFLLGLPRKYKLITTMHTALPLNEKFKGNPLKNFFRRVLYLLQNKLISRTSDLVFVHSDFFVPVLVQDYGFKKEKIVVLPQGIVEGVNAIPKNKAKKELNLSGPVYLLIGNLNYDNGPDRMIKQADKIGKTILVVSSPKSVNDRNQKRLAEYLNNLQDYVKEKNLSKYVRFDIAPISDQMPKWWTYFSAADFVLQAYRGGIGSGIFTHAMATKTPVISSNIQFFKDIEQKYGCIKTVENDEDYAEAIKQALKPSNYSKMKKEAERYVKERSWTAVTKEYKKIYNSLI